MSRTDKAKGERYNKKWRKENREHLRQYKIAYRNKNRKRIYAWNRAHYFRNRAKYLKYSRAVRDRYRAKRAKAQRGWYKKNRIKGLIYARVYRAIKSGRLIRSPFCNHCGLFSKTDAHHHNGYSLEKWADVIWLCRFCHRKETSKENAV